MSISVSGQIRPLIVLVAVMSLSLADERRQQGESKDSNFVEIFKGTNLVSR